jgi:3-hydroxyisobutyrate dehydrogenase-like beta-hydroxyacid dehydrogenase
MTTKNGFKVSVIGTGRMGSALATALFKAGFPTTVWNRTSARTEPLGRLGLHVAPSLKAAVDAADVVIFNVSNYATSLELLKDREVASALSGKMLVQLTTGIPQDAREMASWARQNDTSYLDGAIMGYPSGVGTQDYTVLYSGPEALFDRVKPVLLAFGGNAVLVGAEIGHASALDLAALNFMTGAMFGFLQGQVVCEAERLPAGVFAQTVKDLMPVLDGFLQQLFAKLEKKDYVGDEATIEAWSAVPKELLEWSKDKRMDAGIASAHHELFQRAIRAGQGQADFAYLYEVLRQGK